MKHRNLLISFFLREIATDTYSAGHIVCVNRAEYIPGRDDGPVLKTKETSRLSAVIFIHTNVYAV